MKKLLFLVGIILLSGITVIVAQQSAKSSKPESGNNKYKYCVLERYNTWNTYNGITIKTTKKLHFSDDSTEEDVTKEPTISVLRKLGADGWEMTGTMVTSGDGWSLETCYFMKSY